jgi:hypothetical protein
VTQNLNVQLTKDGWNLVIECLAEFPYKKIAPLVEDIRQQLIKQISETVNKENE